MAVPNNGSRRDIGVGLISVGWMGKLHTRGYQAVPSVYPELGLRPRPVAEGLADAVAWFLEVGWLR